MQAINSCSKESLPKGVNFYSLFATVLTEVISVIHMQGSSSLTLQDILFWLDQKGCQLVHREDPAHMDWREGLKPGDKIKCNGKELTLGMLISPQKLLNDDFKIFELADHPEYVVKIAKNPFQLLIEDQKAKNQQDHWGFRFVRTIANLEQNQQNPPINGLDRQGNCVVIEKLVDPIEKHEWASQQPILVEGDEKVALVLANHLFCMRRWNGIAQNISLAHLMWDKEGVLKSCKVLKRGPFNYNECENYCVQAAKGNIHVLNFLLHVANLVEHPIALYYRLAIEHVFETGTSDLLDRPLPLGFRKQVLQCACKRVVPPSYRAARALLKSL